MAPPDMESASWRGYFAPNRLVAYPILADEGLYLGPWPTGKSAMLAHGLSTRSDIMGSKTFT